MKPDQIDPTLVPARIEVYTCLPVWRELKLDVNSGNSKPDSMGLHVPSRLEGIETRPDSPLHRTAYGVYTCLPVWRELKLKGLAMRRRLRFDRVYTCLPVWRELKLVQKYYGGELTFFEFTRAFPFGGN